MDPRFKERVLSEREVGIGRGSDNTNDRRRNDKGAKTRAVQFEQLSRTTTEKTPRKTKKISSSPSQTRNKVPIPATTLPTNTPTPVTAVITAEPLSPPLDPLPLGAGVGFGGEEPPPDPPPWTKNGFIDSWRDVVIVRPFSFN
jgi:hypothetical protein